MISYTDDEIELFISMQKKHESAFDNFIPMVINAEWHNYLTEDIKRILKGIRKIDDKYTYNKFIIVAHKVPFDRLPLFINTYPEIVSWRLSIGK